MIVTAAVTNRNSWGKDTTQTGAIVNALLRTTGRGDLQVRLMTFSVDKFDDVFVDPLGSINVIGEHENLGDITIQIDKDEIDRFDSIIAGINDRIFDAEFEA